MKYSVVHEIPGRIRVRVSKSDSFSKPEAVAIAGLLETQTGVVKARANSVTGSILINYEGAENRDSILLAVGAITRDYYADIAAQLGDCGETASGLLSSVFFPSAKRILFSALLPPFVRNAITIWRAIPYIRKGLNNVLAKRKLNVEVLDASAIAVSMLRNDFKTASTVMYLLNIGDTLEEWTHSKSRESLGESMRLNIDTVWLKGEDGTEIEIPAAQMSVGDLIAVRQGMMIPADGIVAEGEAAVNQASMTGESEPVLKTLGKTVYAGTTVEEGGIVMKITALAGNTRVAEIAKLIDESESLKAQVQFRAERLADSIVPFSFLLAGLVLLVTRSPIKASAALMTDYSCAIKLATPLTILSAMRSGIKNGVLIKGGKFLEALSSIDTVVFDKTGTLTVSTPAVTKVLPVGDMSEEEILKTAACLEEHFPHSLARAVVKEAQERGIRHREEHDKLNYIVAHGIRSTIFDKTALIGSAHFIFEDEGIPREEAVMKKIEEEYPEATSLYLAIDGKLEGVIFIEDPLREEARCVIGSLKKSGIENVVMLTGDNEHTARHVANKLGITEYRAELLPADKINIIKELGASGCDVAMVGDGINDSPALAASHIGISMSGAADIAKETADIVLYRDGLSRLPYARELSKKTMEKINRNFLSIVGVNSAILIFGITGISTPALSALLHNMFTLGIGLYSMMPINIKKTMP